MMLDPTQMKEKLLAGERIPNPIIGYYGTGDERYPKYRYHHMLLRAISKDINDTLLQDFVTNEIYLKKDY